MSAPRHAHVDEHPGGRKRRNTQQGFTLVELLIALAIFALVFGIASFAYAQYSKHWDGQLGHFEEAAAQYQRVSLVATALENTLPYVVRDDAGTPGFYFLGRDEGLTLVTATPVFTADGAAVIRVFRERSATQGRWNLVYEEAPLSGAPLRYASQELPFSHRLIVLRDLPRIEFRYFGWESFDARVAAMADPTPENQARWYGEYDGLKRREHPKRIGIRLGEEETVIFVPERADVTIQKHLPQD